jgi:methylase of polypeptide subunit release factors
MTQENTPNMPLIQWHEKNVPQSALWRSERGNAPPKRIQVVDDTLSADEAYRLASAGVGMLWRGDFQNAKLLMQALERRLEKRMEKNASPKPARRTSRPAADAAPAAKSARAAALAIANGDDGFDDTALDAAPQASTSQSSANLSASKNFAASVKPNAQDTQDAIAKLFYKHRQAQAQRARVLGLILIPLDADFSVPLPRAPDVKLACSQAWGEPVEKEKTVTSLRELLGIISAFEWRKKGVVVPALGRDKKAIERRIHAHYGVFSPVRGEYIDLVEKAPLPTFKPASELKAFDIGTGSGVLSCVLAMRGIGQIVATDLDARALICAKENITRLVGGRQVKLVEANLFPDVAQHGQADLIVCNPPWLPGTPGSTLERGIYDPSSQMLRGYLSGLKADLAPKGEAWLILSDLAEHLGLREEGELQALIEAADLKIVGQLSTQPRHPKAQDASDPFHAARSRETTTLWRLVLK